MDPVKELTALATAAGLTVECRGMNGHYQIKGGALLVNYYPLSKNRTAYVSGTNRGPKGVSPAEAIAMANRPPKFRGAVKRKQRYPSTKRRIRTKLMKKQRGLCCFCKEPMEVTDDITNMKQATFEHVIPLARGGLDNVNNIKLSCRQCNADRGHDMPEISNG